MVMYLNTIKRGMVAIDNKEKSNIYDIQRLAGFIENVPEDNIYLSENGRILRRWEQFTGNQKHDTVITVHFRLPGGKGGFGSMLRALGAQIEKTTNREACRDLSGRRMRDVNNEKKIGDWLKQQKEEEETRAKRKQERLERLVNPPKHMLKDSTYITEIVENAEKVDDALQQGLRMSAKQGSLSSVLVGTKRKIEHENGKLKRSRLWIGLEGDIDENDLDENDLDENEQIDKFQIAHEIASPVPIKENDIKELEVKEDNIKKANEDIKTLRESNEKLSPVNLETNDHLTDQCVIAASKEINANPLASTGDQKKPLDTEVGPLDLKPYNSAEELEAVGLGRLKSALMSLGLKCGGTLQQRAQRLFITKDIPLDKLDKSLFAKSGKKKV